MGLSRTADDVQEVKFIISAEKSRLSDFKVLSPCPGVNSATKLHEVPAHYCEHQHPRCLRRLTDCQGHAHNKILVIHSAQGKT